MTVLNQQLNEEQLKAVYCIDGPVLVLAGAGSGKTRVLTNRIAYMVETGINPENILAITFTNKAANEMKNRLNEFDCHSERMTISTIHSLCAKILRYDGDKLGYHSNFSIYDDQDTDKVLKTLYEKHYIDDDKIKKTIARHISTAKMYGMTSDQYRKDIGGDYIDTACDVFDEYNSILLSSNAMDFDDLLYNVYKLFKGFPSVLDYYQEKFKYISIDEFQDTNKVQYDIFRMLSEKYRNLFVVGDDDQSIYGWRGADVNNILFFTDDYKDAKVFKLEQNYRSTQKILEVANLIISQNSVRYEKKLWTNNDSGVRIELFQGFTENDEAYYVVSQIRAFVDNNRAKYSDFAILMRVNALSRNFEQECMKYGIPTKVFGGFKFFERKEIKDLTAYLKAINNPFDNEALLRIINTPKRGIGDTTQNKLKELSMDFGISITQVLSDFDNLEVFSSGIRTKLIEFYNLYSALCNEKDKNDLVTFVEKVIKMTHYRQIFEGEDDIERAMNIDEFVQATSEFCQDNENANLSEFLQSMSLISDIDKGENTDSVTLATIHSAKGLEFNTVFIVGLDDGLFPIKRAIYDNKEMQEERRLMYVAITRARQRLYLTRSKSRFLYGERSGTLTSRFYKEIEQMLRPQEVTKYDENGVPTTERTVFRKVAPHMSDVNRYNVGDIVKHSTFGEGIILSINGENGEIAFNGIGKKTLALKYAPLVIIKSK